MNQSFSTERDPTLVESVGRGAMAGTAASLVLLPAVSYLARRVARQREAPVVRLANVVAARLGQASAGMTLAERPVPFVRQILTGAAWGALYGLAKGASRTPTVPGSPVFGTALAVLADRFLPAPLRLFPDVSANPDLPTPFRIGVHLLWGSVLGLAFNLERMVMPAPSESGYESVLPPIGQPRAVPASTAETSVVEVVERAAPPSPGAAERVPPPPDVVGQPAAPTAEGTGAPPPPAVSGATDVAPPPSPSRVAYPPSESPVAEPVSPPPPPWPVGATVGEETVVLEPARREVGAAGSASPEPVGPGAAAPAETLPGAVSEQAVTASYGRNDLIGKMVFTSDNHPLGDVRKVELKYVEVATPVVALGPILYVPFTAFRYCSPRGCYMSQALDELPAAGWNQIPESILEADNLVEPSPRESEVPPPTPAEIQIPFYSDEEAARRFQ